MPLYEPGQIVYANRDLNTDACGDHPAFAHARYGDALYVLAHRPERENPYLLSKDKDGSLPFSASAKELMAQKPFQHNEYGRFGY